MYHIILITSLSFLTSLCFSQNIVIPTNSNHSGGTYSIYRSATDSSIVDNNIRKPLIWVEGFEVNAPMSIRNNYDLMGVILTSQLHAAGYDIVILNFNNPNDYIQRNAKVLEELIQTINNNYVYYSIKNFDLT